MGVEITTQLAPEPSGAPRRARGARASPSTELKKLVGELGLSIRPLHPGVDDPVLGSYFVIDVPDPALAPEVLERLRHSSAVQAAYIKPPDAMP